MINRRVDEDVIQMVKAPDWTDTWHPVSHGDVIRTLNHSVKESGMEVINKYYDLSDDGMRMFGSWTLNERSNGIQWAMGFRQGMDKSMSLGICAGTHVLVCSNMMFAGDDFIEFRRHTKSLDLDELQTIADRSLIGLKKKMGTFADWHKSLLDYKVSGVNFQHLTFEALRQDVLPQSRFKNLLDSYQQELQLNGNCLYSFHGAVTRTLRDDTLFNISDRSSRLNKVVNDFVSDYDINKDLHYVSLN